MNFFYTRNFPNNLEPDSIILLHDNWNDWFHWNTQFSVFYINDNEETVSLGSVKIARSRMRSQDDTEIVDYPTNKPDLPESFTNLDKEFFSLGQDENYYETLLTIPEKNRIKILSGLQDCAYDLSIYEKYKSHPAMSNSLMRGIGERHLIERLHELAKGKTELRKFNFSYLFPEVGPTGDKVRLTFNIDPESIPPSNVQAIIGRNGVGKTTLFSGFIRGVIKGDEQKMKGAGKLQTPTEIMEWEDNSNYFSSLTLLSYSPFDRYGPEKLSAIPSGIKYSYIGLMHNVNGTDGSIPELIPKSARELHKEFCESMSQCLKGVRRDRWQECLKILENDPLFKAADITSLAEENDSSKLNENDWQNKVERLLGKLSSGHLVILLSITRLIEVTEERSLTLIDEPEAHLHPPLISAFIRAVSHLMHNRNGVAIVATHSPVVLQEVPAECVWILNRSGKYISADKPEHETFGENVGSLTREVFSHEVINTGFYRMIADVVDTASSFEEVTAMFNNKLGGEARALARSLFRMKEKKN